MSDESTSEVADRVTKGNPVGGSYREGASACGWLVAGVDEATAGGVEFRACSAPLPAVVDAEGC